VVRNPLPPCRACRGAAAVSTRRFRALLKASAERDRRKSVESKPAPRHALGVVRPCSPQVVSLSNHEGRISHHPGEKCGLERQRAHRRLYEARRRAGHDHQPHPAAKARGEDVGVAPPALAAELLREVVPPEARGLSSIAGPECAPPPWAGPPSGGPTYSLAPSPTNGRSLLTSRRQPGIF